MVKSFYGILFIVLIWSQSCRHSGSKYIISREDSINKASHTKNGITIMPPDYKYAPYIYVMDSANNICYYTLQHEHTLKRSHDENDPERIGLLPKHVTLISPGTEIAFFQQELAKEKNHNYKQSVVFASFSDTIQSDFLDHLLELSKENKIILKVRLATDEEREVISKAQLK